VVYGGSGQTGGCDDAATTTIALPLTINSGTFTYTDDPANVKATFIDTDITDMGTHSVTVTVRYDATKQGSGIKNIPVTFNINF
jgi:hypothetical protein